MTTSTLRSPSFRKLNQKSSSGARAVETSHDELLFKLIELWSQHHHAGLNVRLATGQLLNEKLGKSADRQIYGDGVLKACADKLGLAVSELSRMRCFAANFKSLDDLATKHPNVTTWTQVKDLIPALRRKVSGTETAAVARKASAVETSSRLPVRKTIKSLKNVRDQLEGVRLDKSEAAWNELNDTIRGIVAAASECLGVFYSLVELTAPNGDGTTNQQ